MNRIILIGGGSHCKSVIDVIEQEAKYEIAGIIDKPQLLGSKVLGYPIIGSDSDLNNLSNIQLLTGISKYLGALKSTPSTKFISYF